MKSSSKIDGLLGPADFGVYSPDSKLQLSTGSTLLNLAMGGNPLAGFRGGGYYSMIGDSSAGKSILAMTALAEAVVNPAFADHRLIYDDVENGCGFDLDRMFGVGLRPRLTTPRPGGVCSDTLEDFYYSLDNAMKVGPVIYVLDSIDGLGTKSDQESYERTKKAFEGGKESPGSFGMARAKRNSELLRTVMSPLRDTGSILLILSQTREDTGIGWATKTRSGGKALKFYAMCEVWASVRSQIKKSVRGRDRFIGVKTKWKVAKNRQTGEVHEVYFDIYPSYGIDDLGSCIDWLIEEKWWSMSSRTIDTGSFCGKATRDKLIAEIEKRGLEDRLRVAVGKCWYQIQKGGALVRKSRYGSPNEVSKEPEARKRNKKG